MNRDPQDQPAEARVLINGVSVPPNAPALRLRIAWCVAVIGGFLLLYDTTNWLASRSGTTRCLAFDWEFRLPRISWFVIPYWSIDILMALVALFTIRMGQLRVLLVRLAFILVVSCACFLLWPCVCGHQREIPDDWSALLFRLLHWFDMPYNQAPSLHVSEAIVIAPVYLERLSQRYHRATVVWLASGCVGILFTHQHHLMDLLSGAVIGFLAVRIFRERSESTLGCYTTTSRIRDC